MALLNFPAIELSDDLLSLRQQVRDFIEAQLANHQFSATVDAWLSGYSREFSQALAEQGWLGMTIPTTLGGQGKSPLQRFVVIEELLAAGAPVAAHWVADRQTGPLLVDVGSKQQQEKYLPGIIRGEIYFAIGLSEPNSGSDLASITTKATKVDGGWLLNGRKIWSSGAHFCHAMVVLCRTEALDEKNRHKGMSQLLVDLDQPGITIRPIELINGEHHFNEVSFEDVWIADEMVLGQLGQGWKQVMSELAYERSGPERFLSTLPLFTELVNVVQADAPLYEDERIQSTIGDLSAQLLALHQLSLRVTATLCNGGQADTEAVLVKDLGTRFEKHLSEAARIVISKKGSAAAPTALGRFMEKAILHSPGFTLRGGTNEILRGIIVRGLGLR